MSETTGYRPTTLALGKVLNMFNPYLLMVVIFAGLAALTALDASIVSINLLPFLSGLRWLRVHFITLGVVTETVFGLTAALVAARSTLARPKTRWDIWILLNGGLLTLMVGIPLINQALILIGGSLIFVAACLLLHQLSGLRQSRSASKPTLSGRRFFMTGLSFLLLGIFVGTGLWLGWPEAFRIQTPLEVHIHANSWGFMSLTFAGLIVALYPAWSQRPLAWARSISPIFWMMSVGAFGLVLGPWFNSEFFTVAGIALHLPATVWLLLNVIKPLVRDSGIWRRPGMWHLITSYAWILAPVLVAPLILLKVPGFPGAGVEQSAPQALIYGWVLQFSYAFIPYLFSRAFRPGQPAELGGNWFSLITVHLGGISLWASIFIPAYQSVLFGAAYLLWALSLIPIAYGLWRVVSGAANAIESNVEPAII